LAANLRVASVEKEVPVLSITYSSPVPEKSADIVNALSQAFIDDDLQEKYRFADTAIDVLARQLGDYTTPLSASNTGKEGAQRFAPNLKLSDGDSTTKPQSLVGKSVIALPVPEGDHVFESNSRIIPYSRWPDDPVYRLLLQKLVEARIARAAMLSAHRVITPGEIATEPLFPNPGSFQIVAALLGLMLGILLSYALHSLRGGLVSPNHIDRRSDTPLTAVIPYIKTAADRERMFSRLVLELELQGALPSGTVLTVSSINRHEGKEFVAAGLVQSAMQLGKKVLFVSLDERQKVFANHFQYQTIHDFPDKWYQLPEWQSMLWHWQQHYNLIIIRNKPVADATSAMMVMAAADLNLMVIDGAKAKKSVVRQADILRDKLGLANMSFVLNRANYKETLFQQARKFLSSFGRKQSEARAA
jgi:capsular polysaccharide biosynthesis protein